MTAGKNSNEGNLQTNPPRIGFALNTKERIEFTRCILPGLDCGGFDLIWCDGSKTLEGRALACHEHFKKTSLVEIHHDVTGGPDAAIQFSLKRLLALGYDYVGLIENDVQLSPGWLPALIAAWKAAEQDGFKVGAATARSINSRVLAVSPDYLVKWCIGAGMVLFSRSAAEAVLRDYATTTAKEIHSIFQKTLGVDLSGAWELFMGKPDRGLGADWRYMASILKRGMVGVGTIPSYGKNIDLDMIEIFRTDYVRSVEDKLPAHCLTMEQLKFALAKMPESTLKNLLKIDRFISFFNKRVLNNRSAKFLKPDVRG
jgi:hypothetical protein